MFCLSDIIQNAGKHLFGIFIPHEKMFILYLLTSYALAWVVWRLQNKGKGFFSHAFSSGIYHHKSSWQDYGIFLANGFFYYGVIAQFVLSEKNVSGFVQNALLNIFGTLDHPILNGVSAITVFTLVSALLFDFAIYCAHYMLHKIPAFWAFHKVHHSAEVMTPLTLLRVHPLEIVLNSLAYAIFIGFGIGLFSYFAMQQMTEAKVLGVNAIIFVSLITGIHLRHTHVWVHYPSWLAHLFISPAQHQIHHSTKMRHFDKNLGLTFPFWDKIFGTLYVPKEREEIEFGINKRERNPYTSVTSMYLGPFKECYAIFRASRAGHQ